MCSQIFLSFWLKNLLIIKKKKKTVMSLIYVYFNYHCVYIISLSVCIDMFVFHMVVSSINQLEAVIGPAKHLTQRPPQIFIQRLRALLTSCFALTLIDCVFLCHCWFHHHLIMERVSCPRDILSVVKL